MAVNLEIIRRLVAPADDELPLETRDWPADWHVEFEERAAIMEYDGRLPRPQAEQWAETIVRAAYSLHERSIGDDNV